jgi:DNA-binding transcriptional MerR regulator
LLRAEFRTYILMSLEDQGATLMMRSMPIGEVARRAGLKVPTIRYYEQIGLLTQVPRTASNRRTYGEDVVQRLRFIRHARELGFDIDAVRELLLLAGLPEQPCDRADEIARSRLNQVERKIGQLLGLKRELRGMVADGAHGSIRECRVIEVLAADDA